MEQTNWTQVLADAGVLWRMNYEAEGAHAELTSGKHSDGYCNCAKIVEDPELVAKVAAGIIAKLQSVLGDVKPDWVVGPAYGAITFAHEVAKQLGTKFGFTEIEYTDTGKMQVLKRFDIPENAKVLVIEDVVTTGGSALKTVTTLTDIGVTVLPYVGIILNWSGQTNIGEYTLVPLIDAKMNVYEPVECPLCAKGAPAVRPKSHWHELAR